MSQNFLSIYAKSFNWAGFFLPKKTYKKCSMLYDFCRVADNIADDEGKLEDKEKKFYKFENDFNQKNFENPIITSILKPVFSDPVILRGDHWLQPKCLHDIQSLLPNQHRFGHL